MPESAIVTDYRILRGMERHGFIVTRDGTSRHWTGYRVRNYFVSPGPALDEWWRVFTYRGTEYRLRYFDGCFHPFVTRVGMTPPAFV